MRKAITSRMTYSIKPPPEWKQWSDINFDRFVSGKCLTESVIAPETCINIATHSGMRSKRDKETLMHFF